MNNDMNDAFSLLINRIHPHVRSLAHEHIVGLIEDIGFVGYQDDDFLSNCLDALPEPGHISEDLQPRLLCGMCLNGGGRGGMPLYIEKVVETLA